MISRVLQKISDGSMDSSLVTFMDLPPKDPDDDDENEGDELDDDEEEEDTEPAVIREPDEC
jgi:hypothetical protein